MIYSLVSPHTSTKMIKSCCFLFLLIIFSYQLHKPLSYVASNKMKYSEGLAKRAWICLHPSGNGTCSTILKVTLQNSMKGAVHSPITLPSLTNQLRDIKNNLPLRGEIAYHKNQLTFHTSQALSKPPLLSIEISYADSTG